MKGILEIPEVEIKFEFDNPKISQFRIVGTGPIVDDNSFHYPIGDPIILITSNMPEDLRKSIVDTIQNYCNI